MGKLEAVFRIQLVHPVIDIVGDQPPIVMEIPETGNTVRIQVPRHDKSVKEPPFGGAEMILTVERKWDGQQGKTPSIRASHELGIERDAAMTFYQFFEALRDAVFRRENAVAEHPVVRSEEIASNPLVRSYELQWIYDGNLLQRAKHVQGIPAIEVTEEFWGDAANQLVGGKGVPVYRSFVLDAFYFAQHDPLRGIIMSNAAWELALRYYLSTVAGKRNPVYDVASQMRGIPTLARFAETARGGALFYDWIEQISTDDSDEAKQEIEALRSDKKLVDNLREARNRLLHKGESDPAGQSATDYALAVANAVDWLFEERETNLATTKEQA